MDSLEANEGELTSTMGNLLTSKDEKNDASDTTPTSSTDAFTTTLSSQIAADDPISSTSSDVLNSRKSTVEANEGAQISTSTVVTATSVMNLMNEMSMSDQAPPIVSEKDLLVMNITDTSAEKITENVDDIVQDLENLLGEPTTFDFTVRSKDVKRSSPTKDISTELDEFSAELQRLGGKNTDFGTEFKQGTAAGIRKETSSQVLSNDISEKSKVESFSTVSTEPNMKDVDVKSLSASMAESVEGVQENIENTCEGEFIENQGNCQSEIISGNAEPTSVDKNEGESSDITSTHLKCANSEEMTSDILSKDVFGVVELQPVKEETEVVEGTSNSNLISFCLPTKNESLLFETVSLVQKTDQTLQVVAREEENAVKSLQTVENNELEKCSSIEENEQEIKDNTTSNSEADRIEEIEVQQITHQFVLQETTSMKEVVELPPVEIIQENVTKLKGIYEDDQCESGFKAKEDEATEKIDNFGEDLKEHEDLNVEEVKETSKDEGGSSFEKAEIETAVEIDVSGEALNQHRDSNVEEVDKISKDKDCRFSFVEKKVEATEEIDNAGEVCNAHTNLAIENTQEKNSDVVFDDTVSKAAGNKDESEKSESVDETLQENCLAIGEKSAVQDTHLLESCSTESTMVQMETGKVIDLNVVDSCSTESLLVQMGTGKVKDLNLEESCSTESVMVEMETGREFVEQSKSQLIDVESDITEQSFLQQDSSQKEENIDLELHLLGSADGKNIEGGETLGQKPDIDLLLLKLEDEKNIESNTVVENYLSKLSENTDDGEGEAQPLEPLNDENTGVILEEMQTQKDEISEVNIVEEKLPLEENICETNEAVSSGGIVISGVTFIPAAVDLPQSSLVEDLDFLVQNTVADESISTPALVQQLSDIQEKGDVEVSTSTLEETIKNSTLSLPIEEVSDLEVLNAISTLNDNKSHFELKQSSEENNVLLSSSNLEQPSDVTLGPSVETALPTADEFFEEHNQQDHNLETLLAVASLQNDDYAVARVEDFQPSDDFVPEPSVEEFSTFTRVEEPLKMQESPHEEKKDITNQEQEDKLKEPLVINIDDTDKERQYSPKITIKTNKSSDEIEETVTSASGESEGCKGSLKMTITKQSDNTHSILKIYDPEEDVRQNQETHTELTVPKLIIKPIVPPNEQPHSPKISTRCSKVFSPSSSCTQRSASPRITIKPILKPESNEPLAPLKLTIKPVLKPEDSYRQKHSPKLTIKPIPVPEEECNLEPKVHSPRVTIKPIVKPSEEMDQISSPRITIKPIVKPESVLESVSSTPRVTIKPVMKPQEKEKITEVVETPVGKSSPKITIKPIVKPQGIETPAEDFEDSIKERIVLKINKGNIPGSSKESRRRDAPPEEEKLAKIKLKFSKGGGHPHIVQDDLPTKRLGEQVDYDKFTKRHKIDTDMLTAVTITSIPPQHSKLKEMLSRSGFANNDRVVTIEDDDDDVTIVEETSKESPIVISEESNQDSINVGMDIRDPIADIPVFEITPESVKTLNLQPVQLEAPPTVPTPRKRGRPRKVPLEVREEFKEEPKLVESTRPKRSCRGPSVRMTLGIKPRKPRGPGRGRGSKRGIGTRSTPTPPATPPRTAKEPKLSGAKLRHLKEDLLLLSDKTEVKPIEIDDGLYKSSSQSLLAPPQSDTCISEKADIVMYEEETRMSAETSSRAQTPAKQVVTSIPSVDLVEESQSSVQSTATTESVKVRRSRIEVHQEPEGAVVSADQLAEYYWSGGGPYMLQEQVAQFLGIKSFKRKYPNIARRVVDMQERDFIRESGLACESMCDLGLTAVNSADILDIMYSDFQDKYEEYCKHQRDRQAKDLTNKQKALSLAASQEKTKIDITQQAVQSAANWNANFNKTRRDQRKACMDLQTLTIHFPKGKMKQINKPKIGHYPVALVPGQYTDYYRDFTPTEVNNLPLNTLCYDPLSKGMPHEMDCDSQTDGSGSESDTSTSDSDSSYSGSSDGEDCTLCKTAPKRVAVAVQ